MRFIQIKYTPQLLVLEDIAPKADIHQIPQLEKAKKKKKLFNLNYSHLRPRQQQQQQTNERSE